MTTLRTSLVMIAVVGLWTVPACKKEQVKDAGGQLDLAPQPPPPPPELKETKLEVDGCTIQVKVPEGFKGDPADPGVFHGPGSNLLKVSTDCGCPCGRGGWLAKADQIVLAEINAFTYEDPAGKKYPAQLNYNNKVADGRIEFEVSVAAVPGLLDEPYVAGGVYAFDEQWDKFVVCRYSVTMEAAPTYQTVLQAACKSLQASCPTQ
jgi:hypothetical protein